MISMTKILITCLDEINAIGNKAFNDKDISLLKLLIVRQSSMLCIINKDNIYCMLRTSFYEKEMLILDFIKKVIDEPEFYNRFSSLLTNEKIILGTIKALVCV